MGGDERRVCQDPFHHFFVLYSEDMASKIGNIEASPLPPPSPFGK